MDVSEAVSTAKQHILRLFAEEGISNLGLEEAFFNENEDRWHITLGFSRPWDSPQNAYEMITQVKAPSKRSYKIVEISDKIAKFYL